MTLESIKKEQYSFRNYQHEYSRNMIRDLENYLENIHMPHTSLSIENRRVGLAAVARYVEPNWYCFSHEIWIYSLRSST